MLIIYIVFFLGVGFRSYWQLANEKPKPMPKPVVIGHLFLKITIDASVPSKIPPPVKQKL